MLISNGQNNADGGADLCGAGVFLAGNAIRVVKLLRMPRPCAGNSIPSPKVLVSGSTTVAPTSSNPTGGRNRPPPAAPANWPSWRKKYWLRNRVGQLPRTLAVVLAAALGTLSVFAGDAVRDRRSRAPGRHDTCSFTQRRLRIFAGLPARPAGSASACCDAQYHPRLEAFSTRSSIFNALLLGAIFATGLLSLYGGTSLDSLVRDLLRSPALLRHPPLSGKPIWYWLLSSSPTFPSPT